MKSVIKTLNILEQFITLHNEVGISKLADLSGLSVSTTHRITKVLVTRGYLRQAEKGGKYSLGPKLLEFCATYKGTAKIREIALPLLKKLYETVGESVNLAVFDAGQAVYIEHLEPNYNYSLRIFTEVGNRVPCYCTGVGKIFLAHMPNNEIDALIAGKLDHRTVNTITNSDVLKRQLLTIRQKGFAIDDEENELGVRCIAAPIKNSNGDVIAAVSISGPSVRLSNQRLLRLATPLKKCGLEISRALGFIGK